ncbi:MAG: transporter substrate-binding domain-containing protein, partial [Helicobacteraceae bacterium]|nr:transporter substrate-binding domain-containing protein [Helicobacteraceae bacterium]
MKRFFLMSVLLAARLFAAAAQLDAQNYAFPRNFRDIPGITQGEIQAIEKALAGRESFSFGMMESSECFYQDDGSLDGYAVSLAQVLSEIFGVPFEVKIYKWNDLMLGIKDGSIDFSGGFSPEGKTARGLLMTRPIRERSIKFVARAADATLLDVAFEGASSDSLRVAFMTDSSAERLAVPHLRKQYGDKLNVISINDHVKVADMLRRGEFDMFIADDTWAEIFIGQPDFVVGIFRPQLFKRVAITTNNPQFAPIINAINKILPHGNLQYLYELHRQGRIRFLRKVFINSLSEAERDYYDRR